MTSSTRNQIDQIANPIEDIATLIGEYSGKPVAISSGKQIVAGIGQNLDALALRRRVQDLRQGLFTVAVIGRFKHGKSTLINAILGESIVRVRTIPTTALITVIAYGKCKNVALFESGKSNPKYISWEDFIDIYSLNTEDTDSSTEDRFSKIDYAQIETEHPFIAQGIRLIDSPGLGEDTTRNATTRRYLKQAQAVIFVLDAIRLLSEDEYRFIYEELGQEKLEHVFFAVNRVNQVVQEEIGQLIERLKEVLRPHFKDASGQFDEKYFNRRVFLVNAKGAFDARRQSPTDDMALQESGLLKLENELEEALTNGVHINAVISSSLQVISGTIAESNRRIERQMFAIQQSLETLRVRRKRSKDAIKALTRQKANLLHEIDQQAERSYLKLQLDFNDYLVQQQRDWEKHSAQALPLEAIKLGDLLQCAWDDAIKSRVTNIIQDEITVYVKRLLEEWSSRLHSVLGDDEVAIHKMIYNKLEEFQRALNNIQDEFATGQTKITPDKSLFLPSLHCFSYDITLQNTDDWNSMIGTSVVALYGMLALWVVGIFNPFVLGSAILAALVGLNPFNIVHLFKNRIRTNIGLSLFEKFRKDEKIRSLIEDGLSNHFERLSDELDGLLTSQIKEADESMKQILERMGDSEFEPEQEIERLTQISHLLDKSYCELQVLRDCK